jgi:hypothetical protein
MNTPILVICSYRAKPGQEAALREIMREHVPALQKLGLATPRAPMAMRGADGVYVEVFEWASEAASRSAHDHAEVKRIWGRFAEVCDFVPLASVSEAAKPFAHFHPV